MYRDDVIRAKLGELGWSKARFAEESGLNINTITALCRGDLVSLPTIYTAAEKLGLSMQELFTPKAEEEKEPAAAR
jgi:transcriptional regulator with XRE-family HTH domain